MPQTSATFARAALTAALVLPTACVAVPASAADAPAPTPFTARATGQYVPVKDSAGRTWAPRQGFVAPNKSDVVPTTTDVTGTEDDVLYRIGAMGMTGYRTAVPRPGTYRVTLHVLENWYTSAGRRVYDVNAEGARVLSGVDPWALAGGKRFHAVALTFDVPVNDGSLDLAFLATKDQASIYAVEVVEQPTATTAPAPFALRMTAGTQPVVTRDGRRFEPMDTRVGTWKREKPFGGRDIEGTDDDALLETIAFDFRRIVVPVPAAATYRVTLTSAEPFWRQPGTRVWGVSAEGRVVAPAVDVAAEVGPLRKHDLTFDVPVTDGELTLDVTPTLGRTELSAIEVTSSDPATAVPNPAPPLVRLRPGSFWTQKVGGMPVSADSATTMAPIVNDVRVRFGGIAAVNAYQYNASLAVATPTTPKVRVGFHDCQLKGSVPSGLYDGPAHFVDVPVPADARPAAGTDGELTVYDPAADKVWEFWQMRRASSGGWEACWGGRIDDVSTTDGVFPGSYGVSASGLLVASGVVSIAEAKRGRIEHAVGLGVLDAARLPALPATRADGTLTEPTAVREGQRLRLDPSIDVSTLGLTPFGQMVAKAAQEYGFVVVERSGAVGIGTESGASEKARTGIDPWDHLLGGPAYAALQGFPWDRVQALAYDPAPTTTPVEALDASTRHDPSRRSPGRVSPWAQGGVRGLPPTQDLRRRPGDDRARRHVTGDDAVGGDDAPVLDAGAGEDHRPGAQPHVVTDDGTLARPLLVDDGRARGGAVVGADDRDELAHEALAPDDDRGTGAPDVVELPDVGVLTDLQPVLLAAAAAGDVDERRAVDGGPASETYPRWVARESHGGGHERAGALPTETGAGDDRLAHLADDGLHRISSGAWGAVVAGVP